MSNAECRMPNGRKATAKPHAEFYAIFNQLYLHANAPPMSLAYDRAVKEFRRREQASGVNGTQPVPSQRAVRYAVGKLPAKAVKAARFGHLTKRAFQELHQAGVYGATDAAKQLTTLGAKGDQCGGSAAASRVSQ